MNDTSTAIACNLTKPNLRSRKDVFQRSLTPYLTRATYTSGTSQLVFSKPDVTRKMLEHLMVLERDCCPFFNFDLSETSSHFQLIVTGPEGSEDMVRNFFSVTSGPECACSDSNQPAGFNTKKYAAGFIAMCAVACTVPPALAALGLISVGLGAYISKGIEAVVITAILSVLGFLLVRYVKMRRRRVSS